MPSVSEPTSKNQAASRRPVLDGWRGLAITGVLIAHFFPIPGIDSGRLGVDLFFVLSGLLMSKVLFVDRVPLRRFFARRFSRVYPVFFIYVSLWCLLSVVLNLSDEHQNYLTLITFFRSYWPVEPNIWNTGIPFGHLWSLNVEEHCYVLLALLAWWKVSRTHPAAWLIGIGCLSVGMIVLYAKVPEIAPANSWLRTETLAGHLLLSAGYARIADRWAHRVPPLAPVVALLVAIACYTAPAPGFASWLLSPFLLAFAVNHLDSIPKLAATFLSLHWLRQLGIWSYSIYLWQQPFFQYGMNEQHTFSYWGFFWSTAAVGTGIISFYTVEQPLRNWLNNRW